MIKGYTALIPYEEGFSKKLRIHVYHQNVHFLHVFLHTDLTKTPVCTFNLAVNTQHCVFNLWLLLSLNKRHRLFIFPLPRKRTEWKSNTIWYVCIFNSSKGANNNINKQTLSFVCFYLTFSRKALTTRSTCQSLHRKQQDGCEIVYCYSRISQLTKE